MTIAKRSDPRADGNIVFEAIKGASLAFSASGITTAYTNSEYDVNYRRGSTVP